MATVAETTGITEPGIYQMTNEEYHADRGSLMIMTDNRQDGTLVTRVGINTSDLADWRASLHQRRHEIRSSPRPGKAFRPPVTSGQVEPAGAACEGKLGYLIAAQTAHHPFRDVEPANRTRC